ncbi:uncharacterized protein EV422DRAFT_509320 [Fimicolochytrium jonesii]|uniref:uncharacterized protein n=1 Tax=Fimicolochytrium jonesii TaxID=1396493 RepID=UPI0022FE6358|nr:uncharacterized protein EV422DRAFT_509320 [Fimicolochytrium jonesii]KAI8817106.1 hypothetical protein EV422DRAFT_509320 [Fimicolochytrium jonesii]
MELKRTQQALTRLWSSSSWPKPKPKASASTSKPLKAIDLTLAEDEAVKAKRERAHKRAAEQREAAKGGKGKGREIDTDNELSDEEEGELGGREDTPDLGEYKKGMKALGKGGKGDRSGGGAPFPYVTE